MWLYTNEGFFSVVRDRVASTPDVEKVLVRARFQGDLEAFKKRSGVRAKIRTGEGSDYRYRLTCRRSEWARYLKRYVDSLDYGNFKDSVTDPKHHDAYFKVWGVMANAQNKYNHK